MTQYRLDRRFVLQAVGMTLLFTGAALVVAMVVDNGWVQLIAWLVAIGLAARAVSLWARPPVVATLTDEELTVGGALTVRPVTARWLDVQDVSLEGDRLVVDRGGDTVLVFPTAYVGRRSPELVREVYDRLNTAHGYRRFDPSAD